MVEPSRCQSSEGEPPRPEDGDTLGLDIKEGRRMTSYPERGSSFIDEHSFWLTPADSADSIPGWARVPHLFRILSLPVQPTGLMDLQTSLFTLL